VIARRTAALMAVLAAVPLLSGCVAAAIPVLAASGVIGTQVDGRGGRSSSSRDDRPRVAVDMTAPATRPAAQPEAVRTRAYTARDGTPMEVMTGGARSASASAGAALATPAPAVAPNAKPTGLKTYTLDDGTKVQIVSGGLPAPAPRAAAPAGFGGYDALQAFAGAQGALPRVGSERRSAFLADPRALAPVTRNCSINPAAVLIDLDPQAGVLDPARATRADSGLADMLADLRAQGVAIGWISVNTDQRADAIRQALAASGLDPAGRDELVLLRYPEEAKQARRDEFAKAYCVVAIAGDERADFDELYQYLKDPLLAAPLDRLMGKGWFLIPQPLT
jgi:hypothetical protein